MSNHPLELPETLLEGVTQKQRIANPQLWENNVASTDDVVKEYAESPLKLHNDRNPNLAVMSERPEHRMIVYLRAQGKTPAEIAPLVGLGYQWVLQICRQPWFKKRLMEMIHEAGQDGVQKFLDGEIMPSIVTLAEVRDTAAKASDRVAACNSLLDRALGKAVQHIKTEKLPTVDAAKVEMSALERELEAVRQEQTAVGLPN